ncbi:sulfur carrier protein ThiS [Paenarthrobacter sp. Z7-10]|nr:sulfur carrier protein ThiS [Paenarthrobacter sp. Z7-10]MCZ2403227.1 sulfur carrier protein ThiS [Paenarthrobacter sp. Z7-10]
MAIRLNGTQRELEAGETVGSVVTTVTGRAVGPDGRAIDGRRLGVAVALNAGIVPRSQWAGTVLQAGDEIEIVTAVQGG